MNNLIQITQTQFNGTDVNSVNAKELHSALELKIKFANWIKKQKEVLETYEEGIDFIRTTKTPQNHTVIVKSGLNLQGKECDYILSVDMAKHISLMSKSKKGKEVRKYFIEVEKKSNTQLMSPNQITEALALTARSLQLQDERMDNQHERIQKVEIYMEEDLKSRPVSFVQQRDLLDAKNKKVYQLSDDEKIQKKLHARVWSVFKKNFHLPRYNELPAVKFDEGIWFLNNLEMNDML